MDECGGSPTHTPRYRRQYDGVFVRERLYSLDCQRGGGQSVSCYHVQTYTWETCVCWKTSLCDECSQLNETLFYGTRVPLCEQDFQMLYDCLHKCGYHDSDILNLCIFWQENYPQSVRFLDQFRFFQILLAYVHQLISSGLFYHKLSVFSCRFHKVFNKVFFFRHKKLCREKKIMLSQHIHVTQLFDITLVIGYFHGFCVSITPVVSWCCFEQKKMCLTYIVGGHDMSPGHTVLRRYYTETLFCHVIDQLRNDVSYRPPYGHKYLECLSHFVDSQNRF